MKRLVGILLILGLLLVGCGSSVEPLPPNNSGANGVTPYTPTGDEGPIDKTWISPGKVQVGNFHLGARAEWPIVVHNGNNFEARFSLQHRLPDYVGEGYLRAPTDIIQEWVIITSETPVLAPRETVEVLIILEMPNAVDEDEALFWQATPMGLSYLEELWQGAYDEAYEQYMADKLAEGIKHPEIVCKDDAEVAARKASDIWISGDVEGSLLVFLDDHGSVSTGFLIDEGGGSETLIEQFWEKDYVRAGDLREDKWEFWISVRDTTQTEMIQIELCSRWQVSMRG